MMTPPVIAFQIAIATIILIAGYFGGMVWFMAAIALTVAWTAVRLFGNLLVLQLITIVSAASFAVYFFFLQPAKNTNIDVHAPHSKINRIVTPATIVSPNKIISTNKISTAPIPVTLKKGQKYSAKQLDTIFNFDYKGRAGIKATATGDIVLFISTGQSKYLNIEHENTIYFQGQNTGKGKQELIYGNKKLYDAFGNNNIKILLFKNYIYAGEYTLSSKPFYKSGKWFFPLTPK